MTDGTDTFVTEQEVADRFGVTKRTVHNWRIAGLIPFYRFGSQKIVRFKQSDLDAFLESRREVAS